MRGALPKPADQRVSRYKPHEWVEVADVPYEGEKPSLSADMPPQTHEWWGALTSMPHCVLWSPTDWQYAVLTATIHAAVVKGDLARAAELRIREMHMGITLDARRALRIRYVDPREIPAIEATVVESRFPHADERERRLGRINE